MKKVFEVAGHKFGIEIEDNHPLWKNLENYSPFISEGQTLFCLSLNQDLEVPSDLETVYEGEVLPEEPKLNLYRDGKDWWVEMAPFGNMDAVAWLKMDEGYSKGELLVFKPHYGKFAVDNSMMLMFAFCTACLNTLEMHASVVMNGGKGYLFIAKSGTGKSTQSRMWLENIPGTELLNDDNPILRVMPDGEVRVFGSPWSGKTPCYKNKNVPAGGIARIRRCSENKLTRLNILQAYASVTSSCSGLRAVETMADGLHDSISKVVESVPCYVLDCRPDPEAAMVCKEGICKG